jgi:hypothetical protein
LIRFGRCPGRSLHFNLAFVLYDFVDRQPLDGDDEAGQDQSIDAEAAAQVDGEAMLVGQLQGLQARHAEGMGEVDGDPQDVVGVGSGRDDRAVRQWWVRG